MSYITITNLGSAGDLGSQLQQYSSLYAVAKETNKQIVFPESSVNAGWGFKFSKLINAPEVQIKPNSFFADFVTVKPNDRVLVDPAMFRLDANTNYNIGDLFHIHQYWSSRYYADVFNWTWNDQHYQDALKLYESIKQPGKELISIHVRRGDYLLPQHHHFCRLENDYYGQAIEPYLDNIEKYHFVIFSNDIEWCKENLIEGEMVTFVEQGVDCVDLILMSLCDHNIIANSSYSWWAAFKNRNANKRVTCPTNYLKSYSPLSTLMNGNYFLSAWNNIDNNAN